MSDSPASAFAREVLTAFAFIASDGNPRVVSSDLIPTSLDNVAISIEGDRLRVRVSRERSQYLVDLSPLIADWFDVDVVLEHLDVTTEGGRDDSTWLASLLPQAEMVRRHFDAIVRAVQPDSWPHTRTRLTGLQIKRAKRLFGWEPPHGSTGGA